MLSSRRISWLPAILAIVVGSTSCAADRAVRSESPPPVEEPVSNFTFAHSGELTLLTGDSLLVTVWGRDTHDRLTRATKAHFTLRSASAAQVRADGLLLAQRQGEGWLHASLNTWSDSTHVVVRQEPAARITIRLQIDPLADREWEEAFRIAAATWQSLIGGALEPFAGTSLTEVCRGLGKAITPDLATGDRGISIHVTRSGAFPATSNVGAVGGPCLRRGGARSATAIGMVVLNANIDYTVQDSLNRLVIALHEMGHALGLVPQDDDAGPIPRTFRGANAMEEYRRVTGISLFGIPTDGAGHWGSAVTGDVLGPGGGVTPGVSVVSLGALKDLGYALRLP